ncbi:MAG: riboflavin synthase [Gammaproteobacteria bacterium]|nr:riboflavin synthase [Gammaproteobacteria bacterium]
MFTGIVQAVGNVRGLEARGGDMRLQIDAGGLDLRSMHIGDSIAVNGCCLTAIGKSPAGFAADVSRETLALTTLGGLGAGSPVNLETALTLAAPLGGHLVIGHVDGVGVVDSRVEDARSVRFAIEAPPELARYIARKGCICVDGVSLTVNAVHSGGFEVNAIPHTLEHTVIRGYRTGTRVNLEVDLVARYLERLIAAHAAGAGTD